jgi:hypothetical protein
VCIAVITVWLQFSFPLCQCLAVATLKWHWPRMMSMLFASEYHWPVVTYWPGMLPIVWFIYKLCSTVSVFWLHLHPLVIRGEMKMWEQCFILWPDFRVATSHAGRSRDHYIVTALYTVLLHYSWQKSWKLKTIPLKLQPLKKEMEEADMYTTNSKDEVCFI